MSKKLYVASIEIQIPVLAETAEEAKRIAARTAWRDECNDVSEYDFHASPATYVPDGCEMNSNVWHDGKDDITVEQALAMTPEYVALEERRKDKVAKMNEQLKSRTTR